MEKDKGHLVNIEKVEINNIYTNHIDTAEILSLLNIIKLQNHKVMANIQQLNEKVDELQSALDSEQEAIQAALATLQAAVDSLTQQLADGGTEADRQAVLDKLNSAITDLKGTIPDETPPQE